MYISFLLLIHVICYDLSRSAISGVGVGVGAARVYAKGRMNATMIEKHMVKVNGSLKD